MRGHLHAVMIAASVVEVELARRREIEDELGTTDAMYTALDENKTDNTVEKQNGKRPK